MQRTKVISQDFFEREPAIVARELVGKFLVKGDNQQNSAWMVTEVEAYGGVDDLASHARFGKTSRNEIMWEGGGIFYVYLIYGIYWMLNVVCGKKNIPGAVLIRGLDGIAGPGRVTRSLGINKSYNAKISKVDNGLWFEDRGKEARNIKVTKRIGIDYAGAWTGVMWRFYISPSKKVVNANTVNIPNRKKKV